MSSRVVIGRVQDWMVKERVSHTDASQPALGRHVSAAAPESTTTSGSAVDLDRHAARLWATVLPWQSIIVLSPAFRPLHPLEAAAISQDVQGEGLLLRHIGGADELRVLPPVTSSEYRLYDPFGRQRAEAARMNITVALSSLDWLLRGHLVNSLSAERPT